MLSDVPTDLAEDDPVVMGCHPDCRITPPFGSLIATKNAGVRCPGGWARAQWSGDAGTRRATDQHQACRDSREAARQTLKHSVQL